MVNPRTSIAEELGVGTMTLYTYVPDKASVLEVMLDLAFEETAVQRSEPGWRPFLEAAAGSIMAAYQHHPWALQIFVGGPPLGPSQMRFLETVLQSLADTGLGDEEKLDVALSVASYVRGAAHVSVGITQGEAQSNMSEEQIRVAYAEAYARILDPTEFPMTSALLAGTPVDPPDGDTYDLGFGFGLSRLLDGIEHHIQSKA